MSITSEVKQGWESMRDTKYQTKYICLIPGLIDIDNSFFLERCIVKTSKPKFRPEVESRHNSERDTESSESDTKQQKDEGKKPYRHVDSKDKPQSQVANCVSWTHVSVTLILVCDIIVLLSLSPRTLQDIISCCSFVENKC